MKRTYVLIIFQVLLLSSCGENSLGSKGSSLVSSNSDVTTPVFEVGEDFNLELNSDIEFSTFTATNLSVSSARLNLANEILMESGRVILTNSIDGSHTQTITLNNTFVDPVVIAHIITNNDNDTAEVRVRSITTTSFEVFMEEPDNSSHGSETIAYFVFEKGEYTLSNGVKIEADTSATLSEHAESGAFTTDIIGLNHSFATAPNVFSTLNSYNNAEFKASLISGVSTTGFNLQQSTLGTSTSTVLEDIGWVAISD